MVAHADYFITLGFQQHILRLSEHSVNMLIYLTFLIIVTALKYHSAINHLALIKTTAHSGQCHLISPAKILMTLSSGYYVMTLIIEIRTIKIVTCLSDQSTLQSTCPLENSTFQYTCPAIFFTCQMKT